MSIPLRVLSRRGSCFLRPESAFAPPDVGKDSSSGNPNEVQMTRIRQLYELQLVDTRLARLQGALAALDDGSALRARVDQARAAAEVAQTELHDRQARLRDLELELQSTTGKATKVEHDLYSGRIGNPKELQAMQEDLEALGRQRHRIEDEMLSLMVEIERRLEEVRTVESERDARDRELAEHIEEYAARRRMLTGESEATEKQRAALAAAADPDLLRRYERLRDRKDGIAVTEVISGICAACHMTVPEALRVAAQNSDTVHTCEECGRILYVASE